MKVQNAPQVVILGGGISGMTAAHELAERGFRVSLYERNSFLGGKAFSFIVPDLGTAERKGYPAEHGFRFFAGWYPHTFDTMRRIPYRNQPGGVFDSLVPISHLQVDEYTFAFEGVASTNPTKSVRTPSLPFETPLAWLKCLTTSKQRREAEHEYICWDDFIDQNILDESERLQHLLKQNPKLLASVHSTEASASSVGISLERVVTHPGLNVLDGPTSEVWLNPWHEHLVSLGVEVHLNATVKAIHCADAKISGVTVEVDGEEQLLQADYYLSALPVEILQRLLTDEMLKADPMLGRLHHLKTAWQVGMQFYLKESLPIKKGHFGLSKSPWSLSGIQETDFWPEYENGDFGNGQCKSILSIIIADWDTPGELIQKPARLCTPDEVKEEVWHQLRTYPHGKMGEMFAPAEVLDWALDPGVNLTGDESASNKTPLFMNTIGSWENRPTAHSRIDNLFLAGDYAQTSTHCATMESANESGRRAANSVLAHSQLNATPALIFSEELEKPLSTLKPLKLIDELLFHNGYPHIFDLVDEDTVRAFLAALEPVVRTDGLYNEVLEQCTSAVFDMVEALNRKVPSLPLSPWTIFGLTDRSGDKGTSSEHLATQLSESVSNWANVNMLLVDKMPIAWPANMHAYLDVNNPIFRPVLHSAESKGSQHRPEFTLSLNRWLGIPEEQLAHLLETGQCLHNVSLLIDDVMDNTTVRRGRETAHILFGTSQTLGAAHTALFQLLLSVYIQLGEQCMIASLEEIGRAYHGQASEVYFRDSYICPSEEEYYDIVSNKTGCGFRAIVRSLLALSPLAIPPEVAKLLVGFSTDVGCFFQIRDDYLDLVSEEYAIKKGERASDFEEGKYSFPVVHCLHTKPELHETFVSVFKQTVKSDADKQRLLDCLEQTGSLDYTLNRLQDLHTKIQHELHQLRQFFGAENHRLEAWIGKLAVDIPGCQPLEETASAIVTQPDLYDPLQSGQLSYAALHRAIRNVLAGYHIYFQPSGWTEAEFWKCFPLLLTLEAMIISVDDRNERADATEPVITAEMLRHSKTWKLFSNSSWYDDYMAARYEDAVTYYRMEDEWKKGRLGDESDILRMNSLKSTNFRIAHRIAQNLLEQRKSSNELSRFAALEDYVSLLVEQQEYEMDQQCAVYNVKGHFHQVLNGSGEDRFSHAKQRLAKETETFGLTKLAYTWMSWMRNSKRTEDDDRQLSFSFPKMYATASRIAEMCVRDASLASFSLSGNYTWMANEFCAPPRQLLASDPVLQTLQKDILFR